MGFAAGVVGNLGYGRRSAFFLQLGKIRKMSGKTKELQLPISRVKTIMKSSPDVDSVPQDSLVVVTKATELFIQTLTKEALKNGNGSKIDYCDISKVVSSKGNLFFLKEIIPKKITVREYREIMKREGITDALPSSSDSSEEDDDDDDVDVDDDDGEEEEEEVEEEEDEEDNEGEEEEEEGNEDEDDGDGEADDDAQR